MMPADLKARIKSVIREAVTEQSCGEWDEETIDGDTEMIYNKLWEYFKDES
jgi:hypothetical protein